MSKWLAKCSVQSRFSRANRALKLYLPCLLPQVSFKPLIFVLKYFTWYLTLWTLLVCYMGFQGSSVIKNPTAIKWTSQESEPHKCFSFPVQRKVNVYTILWVFPSSSDDKASACNAGDLGLIPKLDRSPGEVNGNPLQNSCLENSMDRGALWLTVHEVTKNQIWISN